MFFVGLFTSVLFCKSILLWMVELSTLFSFSFYKFLLDEVDEVGMLTMHVSIPDRQALIESQFNFKYEISQQPDKRLS